MAPKTDDETMKDERRLAERISEDISAGLYRPGEWLKQIDMANSLGVSRLELRKALDELAFRKKVVHVLEKGYRVGAPDPEEIAHARAVRVLLETGAASLVLKKITRSELEMLKVLAANFWRAVDEATPREQNSANHLFHDQMYAVAGNPVLSDLIRDVRDRARGSPTYSWPSLRAMRQSSKDHEDIVAALEARDEQALVDVIRRHILKPEVEP
jgi:DNA-binding GntR family transcriptional regulator